MIAEACHAMIKARGLTVPPATRHYAALIPEAMAAEVEFGSQAEGFSVSRAKAVS